ncbi:hypothetical protein SH467x_004240 [Pirellulaceae bacterium SH467]|jgi:hypothetical protein
MIETVPNISNEMILQAISSELPALEPRLQLAVAMMLRQESLGQNGVSDATLDGPIRCQIQSAYLRLQSLIDQQSAVAQELDQLATSSPCEFEPNQIWILIRAIKAQSRLVDLMIP